MKKLVPESIEETLQLNFKDNLSEGKIGDWAEKAKEFVKSTLKKIGGFFVALFDGKPVPAVVPMNIGISFKQGKLPKGVQYVAGSEDIAEESSLSSLKSNVITERVQKSYLEDAAKNKARKKLRKLWENVASLDFKKLNINEAQVSLKFPGKQKIRNVHSDFLTKMITLSYRKPEKVRPLLIWGAPGIGKTAITNSVVNALGPGHRCIDVQTSKMSPDDWTLPAIIKGVGTITGATEKSEGSLSGTKAVDIPKNWLPVYEPAEHDPAFRGKSKQEIAEENAKRNDVANWGEGGIIFLDELSRAIPEVQNTCLKLIHERVIGDRKLGSKWAIVSATNREEDDPEGGQSKIGSALANRFQSYNFVPTVDEWIVWAKGKRINPRIVDFVEFNRSNFYVFDSEELVNTTPRSWEALSDMMEACEEYGDITFTKSELDDIMGANISSKTVEELSAFLCLLETFTPEQILMILTNPTKAPKPKKKGSGFDIVQAKALMGAVCSQSRDKTLTAKELENYVQYFIDLNHPSLAAAALFLIVETHPYIHEQTGDIKDGKHEKYKKAMDMFRAAYGGTKFGSREEVMSSI